MTSQKIMKALRIKVRLTQKQMAEKLWIGRPRISEYENGKRSPSLKNFLSYCEKLNVNPKELLP